MTFSGVWTHILNLKSIQELIMSTFRIHLHRSSSNLRAQVLQKIKQFDGLAQYGQANQNSWLCVWFSLLFCEISILFLDCSREQKKKRMTSGVMMMNENESTWREFTGAIISAGCCVHSYLRLSYICTSAHCSFSLEKKKIKEDKWCLLCFSLNLIDPIKVNYSMICLERSRQSLF